jgi:hypothetical protein
MLKSRLLKYDSRWEQGDLYAVNVEVLSRLSLDDLYENRLGTPLKILGPKPTTDEGRADDEQQHAQGQQPCEQGAANSPGGLRHG